MLARVMRAELRAQRADQREAAAARVKEEERTRNFWCGGAGAGGALVIQGVAPASQNPFATGASGASRRGRSSATAFGGRVSVSGFGYISVFEAPRRYKDRELHF